MPHIYFALTFINGNDIESAGLILQFINVIISFGDALQLLLLAPINGVLWFAIRKIIRPRFDFDKDKLVAIHGDNIYLADFAVIKITLDDAIA